MVAGVSQPSSNVAREIGISQEPQTGVDPSGGHRPLKPANGTLFTMILNNSENSIRDIKPFCH